MKVYILSILFSLSFSLVWSKEYNASFFGIKSDGVTLNTNSIQTGINYIHKEGGGVLVFNVGRYLTGSIELKSNVAIQLKEGAVLVGSLNPYDYNMEGPCYSMIRAINQKNIAIYGKGIIDAQGRQVSYNIIAFFIFLCPITGVFYSNSFYSYVSELIKMNSSRS